MVFQESLGTVRQKAERLEKLAGALSADAQLSAADAADAQRAARLCKADLVTNAVIEFTSVQGVMGSYYAAASGETPQVAQAIGRALPARASPAMRCPTPRWASWSPWPTSSTPSAACSRSARVPPALPTRSRCAVAPSAS